MGKTVGGIDLGTTFSAVAYVNEQGRPEVLRNAEGESTTPSVVLIKDGAVCVGNEAAHRWITDEEHVVRCIKRSMGENDFRFQGMSAVEISAEILKKLKADAEAALGEPLDEVVITCPAYFTAREIENTEQAGVLAGLNVREIVKEPTAAAVYYGVDRMSDGEKVMVCDLGGGTFDATLLELENRAFKPRACSGSRQLGGHDWTMDLVNLVAERYQDEFGEDPRDDVLAAQMLYEACEAAKRDFARVPKTMVPVQFAGKLEQVEVERADFESKTEWRIGQVLMFTEKALAKAKASWSDIDRILLVGGSSRLRRMGEALEQTSRTKVVRSREADLMVAYGAAILAAGKVRPRGGLVEGAPGGLVEVEYTRILSHNMGTRIVDLSGESPRIVNSMILPAGTEAPVSRTKGDYAIPRDGLEYFDLPVVQFEDDYGDDEYEEYASYRCWCNPGAKRGDLVEVTFHYDKSGVISAEASDAKSSKEMRLERRKYEEPDLEDVGQSVPPRRVTFAIDVSYSMEGSDLEAAKKALIDNAKKLLQSGDDCKVGIVSFASSAQVVCEPTTDLRRIERETNAMETCGSTAMDEGIALSIEMLKKAPQDAAKIIVMLTDGMPDDDCVQATIRQAANAKRMGMQLAIAGLGGAYIDEDFMGQITDDYFVAEDNQAISETFAALLTKATERLGGLTDA